MSERIRSYELMFVISPLHSGEEQVEALIERLTQVIQTNGGEVTSINHKSPWGRRRLAYPIRAYSGGESSRRSFTEGYYVLLHFVLGAAKVAELERTIKLTDSILRHLITIIDKKASGSVNVIQNEVEEIEEEEEEDAGVEEKNDDNKDNDNEDKNEDKEDEDKS